MLALSLHCVSNMSQYTIVASPNVTMKEYRLAKTAIVNEISARALEWHATQEVNNDRNPIEESLTFS